MIHPSDNKRPLPLALQSRLQSPPADAVRTLSDQMGAEHIE